MWNEIIVGILFLLIGVLLFSWYNIYKEIKKIMRGEDIEKQRNQDFSVDHISLIPIPGNNSITTPESQETLVIEENETAEVPN